MVSQDYRNGKLTPNENLNYSSKRNLLEKLKGNKVLLLRILFRHIFAFLIYHFVLKNKKDLIIGDNSARYFYGLYNCTPLNERCLEIGFAKQFINKSDFPVLEIGNVMKRYITSNKLISFDKYEIYPEVFNYDFINSFDEYKKLLPPKFNLISISTFEHIGWDENLDHQVCLKVFKILDKLVELGLNSVLISVPIGWNPAFDYYLAYDLIPKNYKLTYFYKKNFRWYKKLSYPRDYSFFLKYKKGLSANCIAIITKNY